MRGCCTPSPRPMQPPSPRPLGSSVRRLRGPLPTQGCGGIALLVSPEGGREGPAAPEGLETSRDFTSL